MFLSQDDVVIRKHLTNSEYFDDERCKREREQPQENDGVDVRLQRGQRGDRQAVVAVVRRKCQRQPRVDGKISSMFRLNSVYSLLQALFWAVQSNHPDVVQLLLDSQYDYDIFDVRGNLPLHYAKLNNFETIVNMLPDNRIRARQRSVVRPMYQIDELHVVR